MKLEKLATDDSYRVKATGIAFRRATVKDAGTIAGHRYAMFCDMGYQDEAVLNSMRSKFLPWVEENLRSGDYLGWFAAAEGEQVVAGAGLWLMDWPAHMLASSPRRGYILNVYTEPLFRRRGLARGLVETVLHWCKVNEVDFVTLHASNEGRSLYEELGFRDGNEMRIIL